MKYQELLENKSLDKISFLLNYYHLLNISETELVIILEIEQMFKQNVIITNKELEKRMNIDNRKIDLCLKNLVKNEYLTFNNNYSTSNLIDTSNVYLKIIDKLYESEIIEKKEYGQQKTQNIIKTFENEFGRRLSPLEIDIVRDWHETYSHELIMYSLTEAVTHNVLNLKYIEKILIDQARIING